MSSLSRRPYRWPKSAGIRTSCQYTSLTKEVCKARLGKKVFQGETNRQLRN